MHRIYSALIEIVAAAVFIIPIWAIYNKLFFRSVKRTIAYIVFGFYLTAILALVGFPSVTSFRLDLSINVIPFVGMMSDFDNVCLNILLFVPYGFFLPILWSGFRSTKNVILTGLLTTCVVEISQIFTFRTTDINDLITNALGTIIGYFFTKWITKNFTKYTLLNSRSNDFYMICGSVVFIMFFLQPFVSSLLWEMVYDSGAWEMMNGSIL